MTLKSAIKKAEKLSGQKVQKNENNEYWVSYKGERVSFHINGRLDENGEGTITGIYTCKRERTFQDQMEEYFPGTFHDNLTQAFKFINYRNK